MENDPAGGKRAYLLANCQVVLLLRLWCTNYSNGIISANKAVSGSFWKFFKVTQSGHRPNMKCVRMIAVWIRAN